MTVNPLPEYYFGPLTPAQVAEGIQSAVSNAKKLYAEAKLLLEAQYWERAAVLAIQSMEEAAKPKHLRVLLLAKTDHELHQAWKAYRTYDARELRRLRFYFECVGSNAIDEDMAPLFDEPTYVTQWLASLRQRGMSVDAFDTGRWSTPSTAIGEGVAAKLVRSAESILSSIPPTMTTASALTLFVKHLKPIWRCTGSELSKAVWACYLEAQECGLLEGDISNWVAIRDELEPLDEKDCFW
ncbi:MAG: AbiV family abortive infection protein [Nitrospira sp.]|nr:AbiV family abortive infection protein [Nitrospira sp.]